jgi:hypothetical protein
VTDLRGVASSGRVLGILMLQTRFPRVPGDIGHAGTFSCAVRHAVVTGATPQRVVRDGDPTLLAAFIEAGLSLVEQGATALTTSCGFLVRFQRQLQTALPVPVWTSSLLLLPRLERAGVVTVDALALGPADLRAAGAASDTPVEGLAPGCSFQRTLLEDLPVLDPVDAKAQVVGAALTLKRRHPGLQHIVLECTNMPPYAGAVQAATGCTVHDITTLIAQRFAEF